MIKLIKQWLCSHNSIKTTTNSKIDSFHIVVETIIKCHDCNKIFENDPRASCCYVMHIHAEILREHYFKEKGIKITQSGIYQQSQRILIPRLKGMHHE
jgi:hypothetical protein